MMLFYTHQRIDICIEKGINSQLNQYSFSDVKNCMFCLQSDIEYLVVFFFFGEIR